MSRAQLLGVAAVALLAGILIGRLGATGAGDAPTTPGPGADATQATNELLVKPAGFSRMRAFIELLDSLEPAGYPLVSEVFRTHGYPPPTGAEVRLLFNAWASVEPSAAFETAIAWAEAGSPAPAKEVLRTWASRDPIAALAAFDSIREDPRLASAPLAMGLASGWAQHGESEGLTRFLVSLPAGSDLEWLVRDVVRQEALRGGLEGVLAWAEQLPHEAKPERVFKRTVFRKIALNYGDTRAEELAPWLAGHQDEQYGATGIHVLARSWGGNDPVAAISWARTLSDRLSREWAVRAAFESWMADDRETAVAWLLAESAGDEAGTLDSALSHYANVRASESGPEGEWLEVLDRMKVPHLRHAAMLTAAKSWYQAAPEAAEAWLATSELSEGERANVRRRSQPRRPRRQGVEASPGEPS